MKVEEDGERRRVLPLHSCGRAAGNRSEARTDVVVNRHNAVDVEHDGR